MSADNGIYIGIFKDTIRVIHAQAIENCSPSDDFPQELTDSSIVLYFGGSKHYSTKDEAWQRAREIYDEMKNDDWFILEYGISEINFDCDFPKISKEEAEKFQNDYWENRKQSKDE